jgi:hypothetical protein
MSSGRRSVLIAAVGLLAWYAITLGFWALRPLHDSVPAGKDRRPAASAPADQKIGPEVLYSAKVSCNNLFASAAGPKVLPVLPAQPEGVNKLGYQRTPCTSVHSQARILFILNTVFVIAAFGIGAWLLRRHRRIASPTAPVGTLAPA